MVLSERCVLAVLHLLVIVFVHFVEFIVVVFNCGELHLVNDLFGSPAMTKFVLCNWNFLQGKSIVFDGDYISSNITTLSTGKGSVQ